MFYKSILDCAKNHDRSLAESPPLQQGSVEKKNVDLKPEEKIEATFYIL